MAKGKLKQKLAKCGGLLINALTLNIPSYFLWSGLVYLATAAVLLVMRPQAIQFLCDVWVDAPACKTCGFDILTCPKNNCYRHAMNVTLLKQAKKVGDPLFEDFKKAAVEWHCIMALQQARTPIAMALLMKSVNEASPQTDAVSNSCIRFHCGVLWQTLRNSDLVNLADRSLATGCTSKTIIKRNGDGNCPCSTQIVSSDDITQMYAFCGWATTTLPPATTAAATTAAATTPAPTTAAPAPASGRRLPSKMLDSGERAADVLVKASGETALASKVVADDDPDATDSTLEGMMRRMSHIKVEKTPDPSVNENAPEYVVGGWGKCKCFQQCTGGVKSRPVDCLAGSCKQPKPPARAKCECSHCAACSVGLSTLIFMATCLGEGFLNLVVCVTILYMNSLPEDHLVKLSWLQFFLGFVVKQIPPLVRICALLNLGQAIFMLVQTYLPTELISFEPDCNDVPQLRILSIFLFVVMLFQIALGVLAKTFNRMYPYLFKPLRASKFPPARWLGQVLRSLGP